MSVRSKPRTGNPIGRPTDGPEPRTVKFMLRLTPSESEAWTAAAADADRNVSDWVRHTINRTLKGGK